MLSRCFPSTDLREALPGHGGETKPGIPGLHRAFIFTGDQGLTFRGQQQAVEMGQWPMGQGVPLGRLRQSGGALGRHGPLSLVLLSLMSSAVTV